MQAKEMPAAEPLLRARLTSCKKGEKRPLLRGMESKAGFEPTTSHCAVGMLPEALPAHKVRLRVSTQYVVFCS